VVSHLQTVALKDEYQLNQLAERFLFVKRVFAERFVEMIQQRYDNYVESVYFFNQGDAIPNVLNLVVFEVDRYQHNSPIYELVLDCVCEELHDENPASFPSPYSDHWNDEYTEQAMLIVAEFWEKIQPELVYDIEVVLKALGFSFVIPTEWDDGLRVINNPIVEVW
jgi:hypothetical protein